MPFFISDSSGDLLNFVIAFRLTSIHFSLRLKDRCSQEFLTLSKQVTTEVCGIDGKGSTCNRHHYDDRDHLHLATDMPITGNKIINKPVYIIHVLF